MEIISVEFNKLGKFQDCINEKKLNIGVGDNVIVETNRGKELAKVVAISQKNDMQELNCDTETQLEPFYILSIATQDEIVKYNELINKGKSLLPHIQKIVKSQKLDIKILSVNFTIDETKILIDFVSESRVDFRNFVKKLASEYKLKIELRQVGDRDETKKVGGIGPCGRVCCCNCFMRDFEKVSIKMAKNQNISLNPTKINGLCGKLMCCLAYENDTYVKMGKTMPRVGESVSTEFGDGVVMYNDILRQQCTVKIIDEDEYKVIDVSKITFKK